MWDEGQAY
jgi:hypothetical protein